MGRRIETDVAGCFWFGFWPGKRVGWGLSLETKNVFSLAIVG